MPSANLSPHVNDVGTRYRITFVDQDGNPLDLTGASVEYRFQRPDGTLITVTGTIEDGPGGVALYTVTAIDNVHDTSGEWLMQATATLADGSVYSSNSYNINIKPLLPVERC